MSNNPLFALFGSLRDHFGGQIPNFSRHTPILVEREIEESLEFESVAPNNPAFPSPRSIYLEGGSQNSIAHSSDLIKGKWIAGSNIVIDSDRAVIPGVSTSGDRLVATGDRLSPLSENTVIKELTLAGATTYTLSFLFKLLQGQFTTGDSIRISGEIDRSRGDIALTQLNPYPQKYRFCETTFTTSGSSQITELNKLTWEVVEITSEGGYVLQCEDLSSDILALELKSVEFLVEGKQTYRIKSNEAALGNRVSIEIYLPERSSDFIAVGDIGILIPSLVKVQCAIICTSNVTFNLAAVQLEQSSWRSSLKLTSDTITKTADALVVYPQFPQKRVSDFAIGISVFNWRGKVNLWQSDNLKISAENSVLSVEIDGVTETLDITNKGFELILNCVRATSLVEIYLNDELVYKQNRDFTLLVESLSLSQTAGALELNKLAFYDRSFEGYEIADFWQSFSSLSFVQPIGLPLSKTEIKAATVSPLKTYLLNGDPVARTVELYHHQGFTSGDLVRVIRSGKTLFTATILALSRRQQVDFVGDGEPLQDNSPSPAGNNPPVLGTLATLDRMSAEIQTGDLLIKDTIVPRRTLVRFPFYDGDFTHQITSAQVNAKVFGLSSITNLVPGWAIVHDLHYQVVADVQIRLLTIGSRTVELSSPNGAIAPGQYISQPQSSQIVSPRNYKAAIERITGVEIVALYSNSIEVANYNNHPVVINPWLIPML